MKRLIYILISLVIFTSCDYHYEERDIKSVVVNKSYSPSHTTWMSVPMQVGKVHTVRMQPVHHSESWSITVKYIDSTYTNVNEVYTYFCSGKEYSSVTVGDTIFTKCQIKVDNK